MPSLRHTRSPGAALTLSETVLSLFLLLAAMVLVATLFLTGLRYTARSEKRTLAVLVAQKKMARLRLWARTPSGSGFNFDDWSSVDGSSAPDPEEGLFQVAVSARPALSKSPSTSLEDGQSASTQRKMEHSAVRVCVSVWDRHEPQQVVRLWSLIGEPERSLGALTITPASPVPALVAHDQTLNLSVVARDAQGRELKDLFFSWYVLPRGGNGTIASQSRDGKTASFIHQVVIRPPGTPPPGLILHVGGRVEVIARASYRSRPLEASLALELAP